MVKIKVKVNNTTIGAPKGMSEIELLVLKKRMGRDIKSKARRKRPRNPNEKEVLLRWEKETGKKIGEI